MLYGGHRRVEVHDHDIVLPQGLADRHVRRVHSACRQTSEGKVHQGNTRRSSLLVTMALLARAMAMTVQTIYRRPSCSALAAPAPRAGRPRCRWGDLMRAA